MIFDNISIQTKHIAEQLKNFFFNNDEVKQRDNIVKQWSGKLWRAHPWAYEVLKNASDLELARKNFYQGIVERERAIRSKKLSVHPLEWSIIRDACYVMRNIISKR